MRTPTEMSSSMLFSLRPPDCDLLSDLRLKWKMLPPDLLRLRLTSSSLSLTASLSGAYATLPLSKSSNPHPPSKKKFSSTFLQSSFLSNPIPPLPQYLVLSFLWPDVLPLLVSHSHSLSLPFHSNLPIALHKHNISSSVHPPVALTVFQIFLLVFVHLFIYLFGAFVCENKVFFIPFQLATLCYIPNGRAGT